MIDSTNATPSVRRRLMWVIWVLCFLAGSLPQQAAADYTVQQGDVLQISVVGAPGLDRRVAVDAGGKVSLPLLGEIDAAGKSLSELGDTLRALLSSKNIARHADVVIDVAEYRPVYVGGDVVKPGAYHYRPGMTVRDAVSLAEGYDVLHLHGHDRTIEAANAQADYESYAIEFAKHAIEIVRLKAELANQHDLDLKSLPNLPVKPDVLAQITQFERQRLEADWQNRDRDKAHLTQMLNVTKDQLAALVREQQQDAAALNQQNFFLARGRALMQRGLLQNSRIEELQRTAATAQSQLFEMQARVAQAQKEVDDFNRKLQTIDDQQRVQVLQALQDATTQSATARYRFEAAAEKVGYVGKAQNPYDAPVEPPKITIYRLVNANQQTLAANDTTILAPGDNIAIVTKPVAHKPAAGPHPAITGRS